MIAVNMLRYHNQFTMKMSEEQLRFLKLKVDLLDQKFQQENGYSQYENILLKEAQKIAEANQVIH